ncbi:MAG: hypothetical protein ACN4GW_21705 [Desulforhopalus sp.]
MSLLQETIVYIWLIPVVAQIIIPLAILVGWAVKIMLSNLLGKMSVSSTIA